MSNEWTSQQTMSMSYKPQTSQLCHRCGEYGRASIKIYLQTDKGPKFLCNSVICVYCNGKKGQWETMYTGEPGYPDYQLRATRLPAGLTWNDVQRALMAKPTCRIFTAEDLNKAKYGRLF